MHSQHSDRSKHPVQPSPVAEEGATDEQEAELQDTELQEQYRKAYIEQMKRRLYPGCGDDGTFF